jgi:hypothetical protein
MLLAFVAGAQSNLLNNVSNLSAKEVGSRTPKEFRQIISFYHDIQEET